MGDRTIRFNEHTVHETEGRKKGTVYEAGDIVTLRDDYAEKWVRRGRAEFFEVQHKPLRPSDRNKAAKKTR